MPLLLKPQATPNPLWTQTYKDVISRLTYQDKKQTLPIELWPEWKAVFEMDAPILLPMGGEGSGKSFHNGLYATAHMFYDIQFGGNLYWVVGADFEDARKDFDYILDFQTQLSNVDKDGSSLPSKRDQQCILKTLTGQTVVTISSYDFTKIAREEPDGIVGAEISRWFEETFERCEGRLIRKYPHSWSICSGSFETSDGWLPDLHDFAQGPNDRGIRSFSIPSWANRVKYPGGRYDAAILRVEAGRSPEKFLERFGAVPVPSKKLVCHSFRRALHIDSSLEYNPDLPVYIGVDPGGVVYAVEFVQFTPDGEIHLIDEVYVHRWPHDAVINEFKSKPTSMVVEGGAIDIAATQPQNAMPLALDEWYKDTGLTLWTQKHAVDDSVDRLMWALAPNPNTGRPRLRVSPRCPGFIAECGGGRSPVPDGGPWMRHESKQGLGPPQRANDHACKALAYLLQGPYGQMAHARAVEASTPVSYLTRAPTRSFDDPNWGDDSEVDAVAYIGARRAR